MKRAFPEYQKKSKEELNQMLENAIVVFDTNVLLNLYRYSEDTRNALKRVIEWCGDRLFMPYQVGYEFYNKRLEVIDEQTKHKSNIEIELDKELNQISSKCRSFSSFYDIVKKDFEKLKEKIASEDKKREHFENKDTVLDFLETVFDGKVGINFTEDETKKLEKEAQDRVGKKIPPAYKDSGKDNGNQFGDFYIWKQMIAKSKEINKDLIFITEDAKEDWWYIVNGKTISPRVELLREFIKETSGNSFQMYRTNEFIKHINNKLEEKVSPKASDEIKNMTMISDCYTNLIKEADLSKFFLIQYLKGNGEKYNEIDFKKYLVEKILDKGEVTSDLLNKYISFFLVSQLNKKNDFQSDNVKINKNLIEKLKIVLDKTK